MFCPKCGNDKLKVIAVQKDEYNMRELFCQACGLLMKTKEILLEVKSYETKRYVPLEEWYKIRKVK